MEILKNVYKIDKLHGCNVYLLISGTGLTLVDTGVRGNSDRIIETIHNIGCDVSDLRQIILTHAHMDHTGSADELARSSGAAVVAHQDEVSYIEHTQALPPVTWMLRFLNWSDRVVFKARGCKVDSVVKEGDRVDALGGLQVVHTPGHTPGSLSLYHPERRILFCGDALFNAHPITGKPGLRLPFRSVSVDNEQARESVSRLSRLHVDALCCGHGEPILQRAGEQINKLIEGG